MQSLLIESVNIVVGNDLARVNLVIEDGAIKKITKLKPNSSLDRHIDASGLIALPGPIDAHVHLRDMNLSYKETFTSGTQAAAAGGFTTVIDMPNTKPPTVSASDLIEKMKRAQNQIFTNVAFQGALVDDRLEVFKMKNRGAVAFKLYLNKALETFNSSDNVKLRSALQAAKFSKALVTVHAEDGAAIRALQTCSVAEGKVTVKDFLKAHSPAMELAAVKSILNLSAKLGVRVHICHITTQQAVELVTRTKWATCEATPHHLTLDDAVFERHGTMAICVPPIRNRQHKRRLWNLFVKGQVDVLASDHAPHTVEEKKTNNAWNAASGIPGLETSLPIMLTQVWNGKLSLRRLVESTSTSPAKIFGLKRKGKLRAGYDADLVLVDPKMESVITPSKFLTKAKYSPFEGMKCRGKAVCTIVNGNVVYENEEIVAPPVGRILRSET